MKTSEQRNGSGPIFSGPSCIEFGKLELQRPSLDDVFLTKTGRSLREN